MNFVEHETDCMDLITVAVCIITCFRPEGLRRLLEGLASQEFCDNPRPNIRLVVVDNDVQGSARPVCHEFLSHYEIPLDYDIEVKRGIPFARNHAIDMVKHQVDFIAIIDDDEVPASTWLDELITAQQEFAADILTGPVLPYFMEPTAHWLCPFFGSGRLPNGQNLQDNYNYVYTSNLLAKARLFQQMRFDERFGLIGAEDTHLFMQIFAQGYKVVWADRALVTEWLPGSRANYQWLWQRAYSKGNRFAICELICRNTLTTRIQRIVKGAIRLFQGLATIIIAFGRKSLLIRGGQMICLGIGMIIGSFNIAYHEYNKIHSV